MIQKKSNTVDKIRVLYDADIHRSYYDKTAMRSGIFFVDYSILKEFAKSPLLDITLYIEPEGRLIIERILAENPSDYPNVKVYDGTPQEFDLYFSPYAEIPSEIRSTKLTRFTISYDLIPIVEAESHSESVEGSRFHGIVTSWNYDDYLFSISDYTKQDLIKYMPKLDPKKITTTLLAASDNFYQDLDTDKHVKLRKKYNIPLDKKYIFSLCTLEPRKNLVFSVKNFIKFIEKNKIDDLVIVLGGGHWDMFIKSLEKELDKLEAFKGKIIRTGYIDDEDLASLYSHAECSVYTSIYEGFGLPPLEAMQCGCPVITSNVTSIPEVVGDAGIMVAPTDNSAMINAYEQIYFNHKLRDELSRKGLKRAKSFSWEKCAKVMIDTFQKTPLTAKTIHIEHDVKSHGIKILYDAHWHQQYYSKDAMRSGLFMVDMNILKQFAQYPFLEISLYIGENVRKTLEPVLTRLLTEEADIYKNVSIYNGEAKEFDMYFSPYEQVPDNIRKSGIACYTISYDLIPVLLADLHLHSDEDSQFNRLVRSWTFDDYFFTISEHTKSDLIKHLPKLDPNKITTALLAASENFYQDNDKERHKIIRKKYNIPLDKKYVFSLCTLEPRKNLIFSVKNFVKFIEKNNIDDLIFVLGGGHWDAFMQQLEAELENLEELKSKIIKTGYVDDEDLASLYSHAECTVYTSLYEGFGLPPLEAMQCGCPVITSNTSSLPEVVGDAGIMIDPTDDSAMIKAYEKIYFDENLKNELSQKGLERAKLFSWEKCAKIMVDTFLKNSYKPTKICMPELQIIEPCVNEISCEPPKANHKIKYYILGIPVLRIAKANDVKRVNFLGLPILRRSKNDGITRYKVLCLQVLRVAKSDTEKRISILGLPIVKKTRNAEYKRTYLFGIRVYKKKVRSDMSILNEKLDWANNRLNQIDSIQAKVNQIDEVQAKLGQLDSIQAKVNQIDEVHAGLSQLDSIQAKVNQIDEVHAGLSQLDLIQAKLNQLDDVQSKLHQLEDVQSKLTKLSEIQKQLSQVEHTVESIKRFTKAPEGLSFATISGEEIRKPEAFIPNSAKDCILCGEQAYKVFEAKIMNKYTAEYYLCNNCNTLHIGNVSWFEEAYKESINVEDTGILYRNETIRNSLTIVLSVLFGGGGKYLDYAGGYGFLTRLMRDVGFDFYWYDKYTSNITSIGFEGNLSETYDAVTAFEVFEHLDNPIDEIEKMLQLSKTIIFSTEKLPVDVPEPDEWWYYGLSHGQHITFFSEKSFEYLSKRYNLNYYNVHGLHILTDKVLLASDFEHVSFEFVKKSMKTKLMDDSSKMANRVLTQDKA